MADITDIQLKIKAVEFALDSFAEFENNEEERKKYLREHFTAKPGLKTYFGFSLNKLQDVLIKLQDEKNLLLTQLLAQPQDATNISHKVDALTINMEEMKLETRKVLSHLVSLQDEKSAQNSGQKSVTGSDLDRGKVLYDNLQKTEIIDQDVVGSGLPAMPNDIIVVAQAMLNKKLRPNENFLVELYTPHIMKIISEIDPNLRLVNSEVYPWIHVPSQDKKLELKPDLFSAHHAFIEYRPPYKNVPSITRSSAISNAPENVEMRSLFGRFHAWECRSSIHCIFDAKWKLDYGVFGDKSKYLQICGDQLNDHDDQPVKLRGILFDVENFWMIESYGNAIVTLVECKWNILGSKKILVDFLSSKDPWMEAATALCNQLHVSIVDYSTTSFSTTNTTSTTTAVKCAWLGAGANGRIFELTDGTVMKVVIGKRSQMVEREYLLMLKYFLQRDVSSSIFPIVEHSYRCGVVCDNVEYAGYLLQKKGEKIGLPLSKIMITELARSMHVLHSHEVIHSDPRLDNVLLVDGQLKWIDFRDSVSVTARVDMRYDVYILCRSLDISIQKPDMDIEEYIVEKSVDKLIEILLRASSEKA